VKLRLELAKEEADSVPETGVQLCEMTPGMLIQIGFELEEQQLRPFLSSYTSFLTFIMLGD
jgi:hypothetical protein